MKTDRELLELAAKAAGIKLLFWEGVCRNVTGLHEMANIYAAPHWNPLTDDGDALRLAVKLCLEIDVHHTGIAVRTPCGQKVLISADEVKCGYAATRRAITRAAAAIGEAMK